MKVVYLKSAIKDVQKIKSKKVQKTSNIVVKSIGVHTKISSVKKILGHASAYRMRIGNYGLGFYLKKDMVVLDRFARRNDIHKLFS